MMEDLQLRGLSAKTQDAYLRAVRQLAEHYTCTCAASAGVTSRPI
jgi:hypothetical protein